MKKSVQAAIVSTLMAFTIVLAPEETFAKRRGMTGFRTSGYHYHSVKSYRSSSRSFYKTGRPKINRNPSVRRQFLAVRGIKKLPRGYEVDHRVPLSQGGSDTIGNMQILSKEAHNRKTAAERRRY